MNPFQYWADEMRGYFYCLTRFVDWNLKDKTACCVLQPVQKVLVLVKENSST